MIDLKNEHIINGYWNIPDIPEHFSLERSSLKINKMSFNKVIERLTEFLDPMSDIKCSYHMNHGRVDCRAKTGGISMLKFIIQFWKFNPQNHKKIVVIVL